MRFTNITDGPRGLNTYDKAGAFAGTVMVGPGQTSDDLTLPAAELDSAKASGWWQIEGGHAKADDKPAGPTAVHRGAGSYSVMSGDTEVKTGLTKDEAAAFNALSDDDKAKAVADKPGQG